MDAFTLAGKNFHSRLLLGTARYPSLKALTDAVTHSNAEIVTISLRRETPGQRGNNDFWETIRSLPVTLLPNTAGCRSPREAVATAHMARELFETNWIKLEVTGEEYSLRPDPFGLLEAARILIQDGFEVFPYTTDDLVVAERLLTAGCRILMPWGSPIGSGQGLLHRWNLRVMRARFPEIPLIVDAGIGRPSHAGDALELGYDAVLVNTAVALAGDPPMMAKAFALATQAGRTAYLAKGMEPRDHAVPSTPLVGTPFWQQFSSSSPAVKITAKGKEF